jgi:hypothetical protein
MAALGMDEEILSTKWVWMCSMCTRCMYVCPMKINIPQLVSTPGQLARAGKRPKGILGSCDMALRNDTCSAMGATEEDFQFVVEDVLEEYQEAQPEFAEMQAPGQQKRVPLLFLNQNSSEPVTEPDEMVPLWKILHLAGADWTYGTKGWAAENYCMFSVTMSLEAHRRGQGQGGGGFGLQGLAQHRVRARTLRSPVRTAKIQHRLQLSKSKASFNTTPSGSGRASSSLQFRLEQGSQDQVHRPGPLPAGAQILRRPGGRRPALRGQGGGRRRKLHRHAPQPLQQLLLRRRRRLPAVRVPG